MMNLTSNFVSGSCDGRYAVQCLLGSHGLVNYKVLGRRCCSIRNFRKRMLRVYCESRTTEMQIRKCSPFLESVLLCGNGVLPSTEWKAVPDIWRTSAEKFGDCIALVDPYHDPPTNITYKQLEQEILNFSEGLRVIGVRPGEKLALFADNSCRWLVADQVVCRYYGYWSSQCGEGFKIFS